MTMNGQSGLVLPDPISNSEVKQADVPGCTVLLDGNSGSLFITFSFY